MQVIIFYAETQIVIKVNRRGAILSSYTYSRTPPFALQKYGKLCTEFGMLLKGVAGNAVTAQ